MSSRQAPTVLVMAAGEGTRMRSSLPKVLHPVCGRAMVAWPIAAAREAGAARVCVIVSPGQELTGHVEGEFETVVQEVADGTGGAVRAAAAIVRESGTVVILSGDVPLVSAEVISRLLATHAERNPGATVMTHVMDDPGSYGRIIRDADGDIEKVVEAKTAGDATAAELEIREINTGIYAFEGEPLAEALERLTNDNAQGEYYLPDVLPLMREAGCRIAAHIEPDRHVNLGINTRADLAEVEAEARGLINRAHLLAGAGITDPDRTYIDATVELAADSRIEPGCVLRGRTSVAAGATVGPYAVLDDVEVGAGAIVGPHSVLRGARVGESASVGPFSFLRPGAELHEGSKAGAFVEIKESVVGAGSKVPHLSYVGDATIGERSNLGAGTITANYDGFAKHRTEIGDEVRIASDTTLIAPVRVGDRAYTGAGAVISEDVPDGALGVKEGRQRNIEGYAARRLEAAKEQGEKGSES